MKHLQRVWHASKERLPFGHLVPSPILGLANAPIVETKFLELAMSLLDFSPRIPLGTFSILLSTNFMSTKHHSYKREIWQYDKANYNLYNQVKKISETILHSAE